MTAPATHQTRVAAWMLECFGEEISSDKVERNDRFLEEALELVQSTGYSPDRAHALVRYVFGRPAGEPGQEVGGVLVTLAALCNAHVIDLDTEARREIDRITRPEMVLKIRAKQAAKPTGSALPVAEVSAERLGAPLHADMPRAGERVEHRKGGAYEVVGAAKVQTDTPLADYAEVVVYRSETDGEIWVRPVAEFLDGRFSPLPAVGPVEHFLGALATAQAYLAMNPVWPGARPLETAAQSLLASVSTTYRKRNGQIGSIEGDDGEISYIVPFDAVETLRIAAAEQAFASIGSDTAEKPIEAAREDGWRSIAPEDCEVATVQTIGTITLRNSHPAWVRDDDGRTYEAVWTVDDRGRAYWWDIEAESPVDPVAIYPHPLAARASREAQPATDGGAADA